MHLKTIHTALAPNLTWRAVFQSLAWLLLPWNWLRWRRGPDLEVLERAMEDRLGAKYTVALGSGREALLYALQTLDFPKGSEIIVQSFTCMVVVNAIRWAGLVPVYVDIDASYNMDANDLKKKISTKTHAVIIQHTFGIPANIDGVKAILQDSRILLIEDCAHALGARYNNREVGTFGDLSIFSFGRSKVISSVNGGMVALFNSDLLNKFLDREKHLKHWSRWRIAQTLLHTPVSLLAKIFYFSPLGKVIMVTAQKLRLINLEVTPAEKRSGRPSYFPSTMPNAIASLALEQLKLLEDFNNKRRQIAQFYYSQLKHGRSIAPGYTPGAIFLRYPLLVANKQAVMLAAKKEGVILGDWYSSPIAPQDIDNSKTGYVGGSCPLCEKYNDMVINLPTHHELSHHDLKRIVNIVNKYAKN